MDKAHGVGIDNISLDLMLGIPMQTPESLESSLDFIHQAAPSHVSAYMLKIEENTPFYRIKYALKIADEDGLTSKEGVYAGGDAVTGAATVILAMGAGKKAAAAMDKYMQSK